jgi:hypothetical protein
MEVFAKLPFLDSEFELRLSNIPVSDLFATLNGVIPTLLRVRGISVLAAARLAFYFRQDIWS